MAVGHDATRQLPAPAEAGDDLALVVRPLARFVEPTDVTKATIYAAPADQALPLVGEVAFDLFAVLLHQPGHLDSLAHRDAALA